MYIVDFYDDIENEYLRLFSTREKAIDFALIEYDSFLRTNNIKPGDLYPDMMEAAEQLQKKDLIEEFVFIKPIVLDNASRVY